MAQLFLTSSVNMVAHDVVKHIDLPNNKKLAFIDTAAEVETGDKKWLQADRQSLVTTGFEVSDYTLTGKNQADLENDLAEFNVLYFSGGNTFYLLQQAQQSGLTKIIRDLIFNQDKIYIGTSAGSIIAGPDLSPTLRLDKVEAAPQLQGYQGFGLVNFCLFPHWGSNSFKDLYLNTRLDHAYKKDQVPIMVLTDRQYVQVDNDHLQIRSVAA